MTKTGKPYSGQEQDHVPVQLHQCLRASRDSVCIREKVLTRHEDSAGKLRLASAFSAKYMTRHEYFGLQMRLASARLSQKVEAAEPPPGSVSGGRIPHTDQEQNYVSVQFRQ